MSPIYTKVAWSKAKGAGGGGFAAITKGISKQQKRSTSNNLSPIEQILTFFIAADGGQLTIPYTYGFADAGGQGIFHYRHALFLESQVSRKHARLRYG